MNAYWMTFLGVVLAGFGVAEGWTLQNKVPGDTLSERIRAWLHTDTPGGGWTVRGHLDRAADRVVLVPAAHPRRLNLGWPFSPGEPDLWSFEAIGPVTSGRWVR